MRKFIIPFQQYHKNDFWNQEGVRLKFEHSMTATSEVNDFVPYHALLSGTLVGVGDYKALLYHLNSPKSIEVSTKQYERFVRGFQDQGEWKRLVKKGVTKEYRVRAGQVIHITADGILVPLMTLVVNKAYMLNINKSMPDTSKFMIIIDKALLHKDHRQIYLAFKKYLLDETEMAVTTVPSITGFCYKSLTVEVRKPKTIADSKNMGKQLTVDVLKTLIYG